MKSLWRSSFLTMFLVAVDAVFLASGWTLSYRLREGLNSFFSSPINPIGGYLDAIPILVFAWLLILWRFGFYRHHERIASLNRLGPIFWSVVWMVAAIAIYNVARKPDFSRATLGIFACGVGAYLFVSRTVFRVVKRLAIEHGQGRVRALVLGTGELARETLLRVREHPDIGFRVVGLVRSGDGVDGMDEVDGVDGVDKFASDSLRGEVVEEVAGYPVLGGRGDLVSLVQRHRAEEVFIAVDEMDEDACFEAIEDLQGACRVNCKVVANILYVIANRAKVDEIIGLPVIAFPGNELTPAQAGVKRGMDLVLGGAMALLLAPLSGVFALLLRLDSRGPVLFVHERVGLGGRVFKMVKFRTMRVDADPYAEAPENQLDSRVTRFGRFLRRTSLDEIPQLLNVLRGDMSLVGPRPEMPFITAHYKGWQGARLRVKPGLTGLWQVAGRKNLPLHHNLEYDYHYVKNQSLALDLEILARTVPAVFLGRGAY